jgi:hypothetical protein
MTLEQCGVPAGLALQPEELGGVWVVRHRQWAVRDG